MGVLEKEVVNFAFIPNKNDVQLSNTILFYHIHFNNCFNSVIIMIKFCFSSFRKPYGLFDFFYSGTANTYKRHLKNFFFYIKTYF